MFAQFISPLLACAFFAWATAGVPAASETPHLSVAFLGQGAALPAWAVALSAPAPQQKAQPFSVKREEKDPNNCSVTKDGGQCSTINDNNEKAPRCSVFKGNQGVCSTESSNSGNCSTMSGGGFCSVFGEAKEGTCSVYSQKNRNNQCSVYDHGDDGSHQCSAVGSRKKGDDTQHFCSVTKDGGGSFCSIVSSKNNKFDCSVWGGTGSGNTCSTKDAGSRSYCSVRKGTQGTCTVLDSKDGAQCSTIAPAGETSCSVINGDGSVKEPNKKKKCSGQ